MHKGWPTPPIVVLLVVWMTASAVALQSDGRAVRPAVLQVGRARVLVLSPHPDDATLGAGGLIQHVIRHGGSVRVVQVTGGDAFAPGLRALRPAIAPTAVEYQWYGSVREREAIHALRRLGVARAHVALLGFPDEGLCALASTHRIGAAFESPYTRRDAPPASEQVVRGTMYRGTDVIRELARLLEEVRPTLVVVPHSGDQHPDHCSTHLLAHDALAEAVSHGVPPPRVLHYVVHFPHFPGPKDRNQTIEPPDARLSRDWQWATLPLTAAERAGKRAALETFHSQMLVMPEFLRSFDRANELFVEGEPPLPLPCWCSGENIGTPTRTVH
jgi:LmbE family N-acetylglucosaminyl deacetylase